MTFKALTIETKAGAPPHIAAADDAAIYKALLGANNAMVESKAAQKIAANKVRVYPCIVFLEGRAARVLEGGYEDLSVEVGASGYKRIDLICAVFRRGSDEETITLEVKKGVPSATTAKAPTPVQEDTTSGTLYELPLYEVKLDGAAVSTVTRIAPKIYTQENIASIVKATAAAMPKEGGTFTGNVSIAPGKKFSQAAAPTAGNDLANRNYVDSATARAMAGHNHDGRYLGIKDTAEDSKKLGGKLPSEYAAATHNHDGVYLKISGQAADAKKLGGVDAAKYARLTDVLPDKGTLTDRTDLNTVKEAGRYWLQGGGNYTKSPVSWGALEVYSSPGGDAVIQTVQQNDTVLTRSFTSNQWGEWKPYASDALRLMGEPGTNLNNVKDSGAYPIYSNKSYSNSPIKFGVLTVLKFTDLFVLQDVKNSREHYTRFFTSSGWSDWAEPNGPIAYRSLVEGGKDIDTIRTAGIYQLPSSQGTYRNMPGGEKFGLLRVEGAATSFLVQTLYTTTKTYTRFGSQNTWYQWQSVTQTQV